MVRTGVAVHEESLSIRRHVVGEDVGIGNRFPSVKRKERQRSFRGKSALSQEFRLAVLSHKNYTLARLACNRNRAPEGSAGHSVADRAPSR